MSDLIKCPKCGKDTNKYSPECEHCHEPLKQHFSGSPQVPEARERLVAGGSAPTIEEHGRALFEELEKHAHHLKKCPFCAEEIQAEAIKCRYCGETIKKPSNAALKYKIFLLVFLAFIAASVVLIFMYTGAGSFLKGFARVDGLSAELKNDPVKAKYVKNYITLTDIGTLEETDSISGAAATKYFYGTVKNTGSKVVIKLTVTVYYFDKNGRCIAEGEVSPVLGTKSKPDSLKPSGSKDFQIPIVNANPHWSGPIKAEVSGIEFLE